MYISVEVTPHITEFIRLVLNKLKNWFKIYLSVLNFC